MPIPEEFPINFTQVTNELWGTGTAGKELIGTDSSKDAFAKAVDWAFHPSYKGNKDRLSNFRGYPYSNTCSFAASFNRYYDGVPTPAITFQGTLLSPVSWQTAPTTITTPDNDIKIKFSITNIVGGYTAELVTATDHGTYVVVQTLNANTEYLTSSNPDYLRHFRQISIKITQGPNIWYSNPITIYRSTVAPNPQNDEKINLITDISYFKESNSTYSIYISGFRKNIQTGITEGNVLKLNNTNGNYLPYSPLIQSDNMIDHIYADSDNNIIMGPFSSINNNPRYNIARLEHMGNLRAIASNDRLLNNTNGYQTPIFNKSSDDYKPVPVWYSSNKNGRINFYSINETVERLGGPETTYYQNKITNTLNGTINSGIMRHHIGKMADWGRHDDWRRYFYLVGDIQFQKASDGRFFATNVAIAKIWTEGNAIDDTGEIINEGGLSYSVRMGFGYVLWKIGLSAFGTDWVDGPQIIHIEQQGFINKLLITGKFKTFNGSTKNGIIRLNEDGTTDSTFNTGTGIASISGPFPNYDYPFYKFKNKTLPLSDNGILVYGDVTTFNGVSMPGIIKLNSNGSVDTAFMSNIGTGFNDNVLKIIEVNENGTKYLYVAGAFTTFKGQAVKQIVKLNMNGTQVTSWSRK